jgi:hypothetical protein
VADGEGIGRVLMSERARELQQKAQEFANRPAGAGNDEERVQLLTIAQAFRELAAELAAASKRSPSSDPT